MLEDFARTAGKAENYKYAEAFNRIEVLQRL
jgi:hypothetical protein